MIDTVIKWISEMKIEFLGSAIQILRDIVVSSVAVIGLWKWRSEIKGRAQFDAAMKLARSVYKVRDSIKRCRSPLILAYEFPDKYDAIKATADDHGDAYKHVYNNRFKHINDAMAEFNSNSLEAEVLFGEDMRTRTDVLRKCVVSLFVDIETFVEDKYQGGSILNDRPYKKEIEYAIWDVKEKENQTTININNAIEGIEAMLKSHLRSSKWF